MNDAKQPEQMRPIPDGGLKDAMPSWLKRPPAWRDLPNAEQRRERALPEPDTSEIDPRTLVDVTDLPPWLQAIAARGDIPAPVPDASVDHAVDVVQAATHTPKVEAEPVVDPTLLAEILEATPSEPTVETPPVTNTVQTHGSESVRIHLPLWASILIVALMIALAFALVTMM